MKTHQTGTAWLNINQMPSPGCQLIWRSNDIKDESLSMLTRQLVGQAAHKCSSPPGFLPRVRTLNNNGTDVIFVEVYSVCPVNQSLETTLRETASFAEQAAQLQHGLSANSAAAFRVERRARLGLSAR
jgi:hypothetical protein